MSYKMIELEVENLKAALEQEKEIALDAQVKSADDWEEGYAVGYQAAHDAATEKLDVLLRIIAQFY